MYEGRTVFAQLMGYLPRRTFQLLRCAPVVGVKEFWLQRR